jgi:hypothetical protein
MKFLPIDIANSNFEYESSLLTEEMEDFISNIDDFISYASSILKLRRLPQEKKNSLQKTLFDAIDMRDAYQKSLEEKVEALEVRAEDICTEMEMFEKMMQANEVLLDECLIFVDMQPRIKLQFGMNIFFISECAKC